MLNADLQKDIDIEIEKAEEHVKSFLLDKYFRDTMDLIIKVNKLTEEEGEAVELETIMIILGISEFTNIHEAIQKESGIKTQATVDQIVKDLQVYVFDKLNNVKPVEIVKSEEVKRPLRNEITDAYGSIVDGPKVFDYYEEKRQEEKKFIDSSSNRELESDTVKENSKSIPPTINYITEDMHDVYRELPDKDDKIIKREIEIDMGEENEDDVIRSS